MIDLLLPKKVFSKIRLEAKINYLSIIFRRSETLNAQPVV